MRDGEAAEGAALRAAAAADARFRNAARPFVHGGGGDATPMFGSSRSVE